MDSSWSGLPPAGPVTVEDIIARARAGEGRALETLRETGYYLGQGFATIVKSVDPSRIYIGGEITAGWDLFASMVRDALREHVDHWDQSMLVRQLNQSFFKGTRDSQFATAFLSSFYRETGELLFTNAGHQPPLWYRAATKEWSL